VVPLSAGVSAPARTPVLDVARRLAALEPDLSESIECVLRSGRLILGEQTEAFESEFAAFCGRRHAVAVASGTEALSLSLRALSVGPGDEVIVPAFTAVPTAAAVAATGAVPVPVDVRRDTAGVDPDAVAAARTRRTRVVVPVHLYGRPAEFPDVGLPIVEDAAQAHGAVDPSAPSAAAVYSFYPTKNLGGVGDGGAVVTDDEELAARVRLLRTHGITEGYVHRVVAGNARLSEVEAAALRVGLRRLSSQNARRRSIVARYRAVAPGLRWQAPHDRHVYHLCVARVSDRTAFRNRVAFDTAIHYPRALTQQPAYEQFARAPCPEAEAWAAECVSIPCFPELSDDEIEAVCLGLR
jgi:dTDP-3-amino-3,4,6-trideoxy-alpha-D-glucose transaminase